ncbi:MAG: regulatory protein GemA [Ruminococcus sp.]
MDVKKLYAKAAVLGMVEPGSHEDAFHQLVFGLTGKESVKALTEPEFRKVETELKRRLRSHPSDRRPEQQEAPGMMTKAQRDMAWRQIYTLAALSPSRASEGERMAGAVRKILGITASPKEPLKWVSKEDGSRLIDTLKRYVRTAQKKKVKQDESG